MLGLVACSGDLLPGELVIPGDIPSRTWEGDPGSRLGSGVALWEDGILAGAPGQGGAWVFPAGSRSRGPVDLGSWVWWHEGLPYGARADDGIYRLDEGDAARVVGTPGARTFAAGQMGGGFRVATTWEDGITLLDGTQVVARVAAPGVRRLWVGWERVLAVMCVDGTCGALAWDPLSGALEDLGPAGEDGAVVEVGQVAWWGDPEASGGRGRVCSEEGTCIEGVDGDHLGRSLCQTHAAGVFNKESVPARARVVPLEGGPVLAVDQAIENQPLSLATDDTWLVVGVPSYASHDPGEGRVLQVSLSDL